MSDYLYYCGRCNSLVADTLDNENIACEKCGSKMSTLHINEEEWIDMSTEEKRETLLKYRLFNPQARTNIHTKSKFKQHSGEYDRRRRARRKKAKHIFDFFPFDDDKRAMVLIGCSLVAIALVVGIVLLIAFNSESNIEPPAAAPAADVYPEVEAAAPVADVYPEAEADSMNDSTNQVNNEENEIVTINLSDGPIFERVTRNMADQDIELWQYSMNDGQKYEIAHFYIPALYKLAVGLKDFSIAPNGYMWSSNYFRRKLFDSKLERVAVEWSDGTNNSHHVGWIDRTGNITDVTNIVHPQTSDFSSTLPNDERPFFTSNDELVFLDANDNVFLYFKDGSIINSYPNEDINDTMYGDIGLDIDDKPCQIGSNLDFAYFTAGDNLYSLAAGGGLANDYVKYDDGYVFLWMNENAIGHFGPGVTEICPAGQGAIGWLNNLPDKECYAILGEGNKITITPETDYKLEDLAYAKNTIVFTASRGTERALFKMSYVDRTPGEPELIQTIDNSWGNLVFWDDKDITIPIGSYSSSGVPDAAPTNTSAAYDTSEKDYQFISNFNIEGTWHNIGSGTFGQINKDSVVLFENGRCNVYSPGDTYAFYSEDDHYILQVTGLMGGDYTFSVYTVDKNHIDLIKGSIFIELEKVK